MMPAKKCLQRRQQRWAVWPDDAVSTLGHGFHRLPEKVRQGLRLAKSVIPRRHQSQNWCTVPTLLFVRTTTMTAPQEHGMWSMLLTLSGTCL